MSPALTAGAVLLVLSVVSAAGAVQYIVPGGPTTPHWNDTQGNRIEAHGAGMLYVKEEGRWYWCVVRVRRSLRYGESKKTDSLADHGVNCYSAPSLSGPWTFEGQVRSIP